MSAPASRRTSLDVLRGVSVLIMIEAHVIDSWTRAADRQTPAFRDSLILGGFAAPLFLFLAGVAVAMSAGSKARRSGDPAAAAAAVRRRGLQIFALAFLFRLQSVVLSRAPVWTMLKVDILNIMGPSIAAAAAMWALCKTPRQRIALFALSTLAIVLLTPIVRGFAPLALLPNFLEAYLRPIPGLTNFGFLPWAGFLLAGAGLGVVLDAARDPLADRRANLTFLIGGLLLALIAYGMSFRPPLDPRSSFWTTSISFFAIRLGLMIGAVGLAWLAEQGLALIRSRDDEQAARGPLVLLGRSSLFVYWIHVELVYGLVSNPLHGRFSLPVAWAALGLFAAVIVAVVVFKDSISSKYFKDKQLRGKLNRQVQPLMF